MKPIVFVVDEAAEGGFNAKAVGQSIFTQADTLEELQANVADAITCHFNTPDLPMFTLEFVDSD